MSERTYRLSSDEVRTIAANRLADIDLAIASALDSTERDLWTAERAEQIRLMAGIR